jgi:predicted O-linked N-acetylglucosamine transferase (SPINDLY family)
MPRPPSRRPPPPPARKPPGAFRQQAERQFQAGLVQSRQGDWESAAACFKQACRLQPTDAIYWTNFAQALRKLGQHEDSVTAARQALSIQPHLAVATQLLADGLKAQHRYEDAASALRTVADTTDNTQNRYELANALLQAGKTQQAIEELMRALALTPHFVPGHVQLGNLFKGLKMHQEALECFLTAFELEPQDATTLSAVVYEALHACQWDRFRQHAQALEHLIEAGVKRLPVPFMFLSMSDSRPQQLEVARAFARNQIGVSAPLSTPMRRPESAQGRPRVGYFSYDFRRHPVAVNIVEVIEKHDPAAIDLFVYSYGPDDGSTWRRRIQSAAGDRFLDAHHMANRGLAERIRADGIELLVDLTGFTKDSRTGLLALRPAPVQAAYLGFPGTSGTHFLDYLICDEHIAPQTHADGYSEHLAHLPDTYQPNDRTRTLQAAPTRASCGLPEDAFVFCCMNNNYKITPEVFDVWCRLLLQVPGSVLWLFDANAQARLNLVAHAVARGIGADRFVFAPPVSGDKHLARMRNADLFLDTMPYNAHTTGGDTLWAGVPLLTCPGQTFASRVAGSLVRAAGLPELVAGSLAEYEATALRLARQPLELKALRDRLWANRLSCTLFDSTAATRNLEALYMRMVSRWRQGLPPAFLPAEAAAGARTPRDDAPVVAAASPMPAGAVNHPPERAMVTD